MEGSPHLRYMQVHVGLSQESVVWLLFHEEGSGKGEGNLGTLLHHVSQLPRQLQGALPGPVLTNRSLPGAPQRSLDKQG